MKGKQSAPKKKAKKGFDVEKGALTNRIGKPTAGKVEKDLAKQKRKVAATKPGTAAHKKAVKRERQDVFARNAQTGKI